MHALAARPWAASLCYMTQIASYLGPHRVRPENVRSLPVPSCYRLPLQGPARRQIISPALEISPQELVALMSGSSPFTLLDVRAEKWHAFASLPGSFSIPLKELESGLSRIQSMLQQATGSENPSQAHSAPLVVYCRRGNDSQLAVSLLQDHGFLSARSLRGGLQAWGTEVDKSFPVL